MEKRWGQADLAWGAGLIGIALAVMAVLTPVNTHYPAELILPTAAVLMAIFWRHQTRRLVPAALILLGLFAFVIIDYQYYWGYSGGSYLQLTAGPVDMPISLLLLLAYGLLLLGGWLVWRTTDHTSPAGRLLFGELAEPQRQRDLWAFLLVPVVLMAGELIWPMCWFRGGPLGVALSIAVLAGTYWLVTRRPRVAARLAVAGLILVGILGAVVALSPGGGIATTVWPGHAPVTFSTPTMIDGLVAITNPGLAPVALIQAMLLGAFGVLLTPAVFPSARRFVGLAADGELTKRVQRLTESRAVVVDTAAADLRRLERDLHDGAQARLVALGMNLRAAEKLIPVSPDAALALVAEARETSARALTELRELVRGVHPPVLADRGLDAAISGLAARCPVPVTVQGEVSGVRPAAATEAIAYFVVAEALTNVAKHARATQVVITLDSEEGLLRVSIRDDGIGGADPRGQGLSGLADRLAGVDGRLSVFSPAGGPTVIEVELPCGL